MVSALVFVGCTDPETRVRLEALIEADSEVRDRVESVEARIQTRKQGESGWEVLGATKLFERESGLQWPYTFRSDPQADVGGLTYQLVAIARDSRGSVLAQARVITSFDQARRGALRVTFERMCLGLPELCRGNQTCSRGQCVSAVYDPKAPPPDPMTDPDIEVDAGPSQSGPQPSMEGVASEGDSCATEGELRCAGFASALPLRCESGSWQRQMECSAAQRCDTSDSAMRGSCRAIPSECIGRQPNEPFCYAGMMQVCNADLVASMVRLCFENERCGPNENGEASCTCQPGFVKIDSVCQEPKGCEDDNGGCDPLTKCVPGQGGRTCTGCPPGYAGDGEAGCLPSLATLSSTPIPLSPPFDPSITSYRVSLPVLVQRLQLTAAGPAGSTITINGAPVANDVAWTSPVLALEETSIVMRVETEFGVGKTYTLVVDRKGKEEAYVKAGNSEAETYFSAVIGVDGNTLIVGSAGEDSAASGVDGNPASGTAVDSGAAYVFARASDGSWKQEAYLKPTDTRAEDYFGTGVAVSGDTVAVGAIRRDVRNVTNFSEMSGSVFVYTRSNGGWAFEQELRASDASLGDAFGYAIAADGDTIVVGAPLVGSFGSKYGAAYVFTRTDGKWTERQKLTATEARDLSLFASVLTLEGDTLAVSAHEDDGAADRGGAVYMFNRTNGRFGDAQRLEPEPAVASGFFGFSTAIHGDHLAIGAPRVDNPNRTDEPSGEVWLYTREGTRWSNASVLAAPVQQLGNLFGTGVGLDEGTLFVGASGEGGASRGIGGDPSDRDDNRSGAAYLYSLTDEGWKLSTYFKASNAGRQDGFGWAVGLTKDVAVVAAPFEDGGGQGVHTDVRLDDDSGQNSGAVYVFH